MVIVRIPPLAGEMRCECGSDAQQYQRHQRQHLFAYKYEDRDYADGEKAGDFTDGVQPSNVVPVELRHLGYEIIQQRRPCGKVDGHCSCHQERWALQLPSRKAACGGRRHSGIWGASPIGTVRVMNWVHVSVNRLARGLKWLERSGFVGSKGHDKSPTFARFHSIVRKTTSQLSVYRERVRNLFMANSVAV